MKNCLSSAVIYFMPSKKTSQNLIDFFDSYFISYAVNYLDNGKEQCVGYTDENFDEKDFKKAAQAAGVLLPSYKIELIKNENWLQKTAVHFSPIEVGDFCINDIHEKKELKTKKTLIEINAETAFGSTHPTTQMCLDAISDVAKTNLKPKNILDIGTGSGILSIAAAKKFKKNKPQINAIDIDQESLHLAQQNAINNRVKNVVSVFYSDGYKNKKITFNAPYDLIMANIFARPLISMAKKTAQHLSKDGFVVLSGFTKDQTDWVVEAYQKTGLKPIKLYEKDHWRAALLQKKQTIESLKQTLEKDEAFFVARNNMFLGEDTLNCENKILELTGFSGSAGVVLILKNKTFLFVDGRYTLQAKSQVLKGIEVLESKNFSEDLLSCLKKNHISKLKLNPWAISVSLAEFFKKSGLTLKEDVNAPMSNFVQTRNIFKHAVRYAGASSKQKCLSLALKIPQNFDAVLITSAEELSWLSNLRAVDLPYTPVLRAYGVLYRNGKLKIYQPDCFEKLIKDLKKCKQVATDNNKTPLALASALSAKLLKNFSFEEMLKTKLQKNEIELKGFKKAHIRDGVALVKFLAFLENNKNQNLTELDIVQKLHEYRVRENLYFSESFETIAAVNSNAAIVHYTPTKETNKKIGTNPVLLIDSGGQYFDGTTDITRTMAFGHIRREVKTSFTEVLKAHIALSSCQFKKGIPACELDQICRNVLLSKSKDYKHGTGHSVGHFSNVHEAPFAINPKNTTPVLENYITSIEPGYYKENAYGIRIENLVYTKETGTDGVLCFENLTLCPIDLSLIEESLLTQAEKTWLNKYHQKVFETLKPYLNKSEKNWLYKACRKI